MPTFVHTPVWTWYRYLSPYLESYVVCKPHKLICPQKGYDARKYHCRKNWNISKWPYAARGLYPLHIPTGICWRFMVMRKIVAWRSLWGRPYTSSHSLLWTQDELYYWSNQIFVYHELHILKQFGGHTLHRNSVLTSMWVYAVCNPCFQNKTLKSHFHGYHSLYRAVSTVFPLCKEERTPYSHLLIN